jgi:autotransporter-associated beta strand protein
MNYFTIDGGTGSLVLGDHSSNCLDIIAGVLNGQILGLTNNSATPCVINESVGWRLGGAGAHPFVFTGTGDWIINNHLRSAGSTAVTVRKFGPGTMTWTGTNIPNATFTDPLGTPITIGGGAMIWKTSDLVGGSAGNPNIVHNGTLLKYDPNDGGSCLVAGNVSGTGPVQVNAGTLTCSGANTFSGNINLSGGTLIAGSTENVGVSGPLGLAGTISFGGGTLVYSANNSFDYSSRFDTAPSQAISIDTAGQSVTFAASLGSSGGTLTKAGNGNLVLTGTSSYSGPTTISGGTLAFQGPKSGSGNIILADGVTLGVFNTGTQVSPDTLILGTLTGANLTFDSVSSTTIAPLAAGTIVNNGTTVINIGSGKFHIGSGYPLISWTGGSAPAVMLGIVAGAAGTLSTNGNTIQFNVASVAPVWTGASSSNWSDPFNWTTPYSDPKPVIFDDTASGTTGVIVDIPVHPASVVVDNSTKTYSITSSGVNNIAGNTGLTKQGSGRLTLPGGANTYTGVTTISGGTLSVGMLANGGSASDIGAASSSAANIVFNGGTLQYTGAAASVDRLFTVGLSGGTVDVEGTGPLTLSNPGTSPLLGPLTLSGSTADTNTLASALINSGGVNKSGKGTWVLTSTNSYGGGTEVASGVLQVGANGSTGSLGGGNVSLAAGTAIDFQRTGALIVPGAISGNGSISQNGSGTVILANSNSYTGGTTINTGTLQLGNGSSTGSLPFNAAIVNNSVLVFNTSGSFSYGPASLISGTGNVVVSGGGFIKTLGNNTYTGWTRIDGGSTFQPHEGQDGFLASPVITNNGTLRLVSQDTSFTYAGPITGTGRVQVGANNVNVGVITLTGSNSYTGGTFIGDNQLILGDGSTPGAGAIGGNVQFVNNFTTAQDNSRILTFNRPDDFTFIGTITTNFTSVQFNLGIVQQNGTGTLTLNRNNTYGGGTVVNAGSLVIGDGGFFGSVGFGPVALNSGNPLVINRAGTLTIWGSISGASDIVVNGGGSVTLSASANTYFGSTTVSNGTLIVNGTNMTSSTHVYVGGLGGKGEFTGPVTMEPGTTLIPGASIGTLSCDSGLTLGGNLAIEVNRSVSPSNDFVVVAGVLSNAAPGVLTVKNLGTTPLQVGDKFTLFSKPLLNGAAITVTGARTTWANNLATDGSITVATVVPPPALNFSLSGTNLQFSWSDSLNSFKLQAQTNSLTAGLSNNWADYPGGNVSPVQVPIDTANGTTFFRLVSTP